MGIKLFVSFGTSCPFGLVYVSLQNVLRCISVRGTLLLIFSFPCLINTKTGKDYPGFKSYIGSRAACTTPKS